MNDASGVDEAGPARKPSGPPAPPGPHDAPRSPRRRWLALGVLAAIAVAGGALLLRGGDTPVDTAACERSLATATRLAGLNTGDVAALRLVEEPESLADLTFTDGAGARVSMADFQGRTVLLNLWATWCVPCREEMPTLKALHEAGPAIAVVPVSMDSGTPDKPLAFYAEETLAPLPFYHDGTLGTFNAMKRRGLVLGLPATFLIGPDGCLVGAMNGPADWAGPDARALLSAAAG